MGKPTVCIGENKGADQRLCFHYLDSTIPLPLKSEISSFLLFSVLVQVGLCWICSETTLLVFPQGCLFVFDQLRFKPGCAATEIARGLGSTGIILLE